MHPVNLAATVMSKEFKLVDVSSLDTPRTPASVNWELCVVCQDSKSEPLICPAASKRHDGGAGYKSLADNLLAFNELGEVVGVKIEGLDEGEGIERTLTTRQAKLHKSCRVRYDNLKLQRAQKRKESSGQEAGSGTSASSTKRTRSNTTCVDCMRNALCFFCHQDLGQQYHQVQTLGVDKHVRQAAELLEDTALLAQLSEGDMVAKEAKYHKRCLTFLYNRARAVSETEKRETTYETVVSSVVLAELYTQRMEEHGIKLNQRVHSTRLKERILAQFPNMQEHNKGRDILLAFEDDIGDALAKACEYDHNNDAVHLLRAAQIVRRDMFIEGQGFTGSFSDKCQENSASTLLVTLVSMILEGPSIDSPRQRSAASLTTAQLLKSGSLKATVMQLVVKESKQLAVTDKKLVLTVPPRKDTANLAPCNHEEADTRMMVHAADALECGHRRILIRTVDTDVAIFAVALANERSEVIDALWLTFGTGKNRRYIAAHQIAKALGLEKSRALPVFRAITGCDTVSAFAGHSKKTAWATWNAFPEVTTAFLNLASTPSELPDGVLSTLERFIVLLYDRTSTCCDVNVLRKKLFSRKSRSLEHLPPTRAALEQHRKRAAYQAGHIWGQAAIAFVSLPSPCDWGCMKSGDELEPLWTTLSEVSKSCHELISCGCRKHCGGKCRCKKAALKCTGLCACEGGC
ncbi:hypothetical protein Hamer_G002264 [Homarus americanus]|uniref:Tesmin/TSO1-like CXC domain-containing protein n=1 Tax=Homarus americanus TaxID=6706 RepID=A0A8J5JS14_HOMAM|nr:hypothetical protein Hamer_G002264 [Homarus americanus]